MDHPLIVNLRYAFQTDSELCLVEDLVESGDLLLLIETLGKIPPEDARFYAANIVLAVDYLHTKKILYRDLKSSNLMINSDGYLKLIDFGCAKISHGKSNSICGTAYYMAPEMAEGSREGFQHSKLDFRGWKKV